MINDTQNDSNPQNKLLQQGASKLSEAELLAILLGKGGKTQTALALASEMLTQFGDLPQLFEATLEQFQYKMGRKTQPWVMLQARQELERRYLLARVQKGTGILIRQGTCELLQSPQVIQPLEFLTLYFDVEEHLIRFEEVVAGSLNGTTIYNGEQLINQVVKRALQLQATEVSFIHAQLGAVGFPGPIDLFLGQWLFCALKAVQVRLLDYVVLGKNQSISIVDEDFLT